MIREICENDYETLYSHMKRDFPANELIPFWALKRNFDKGIYRGFFLTGETVIGYAIVTPPEGLQFALINFFAVLPEFRSQGYGTMFLRELTKLYHDRIFVLEVDDPAAAKTDELRDVAIRRVRFYERAGFSVVPTVKARIFGVDMLIMAGVHDGRLSAREVMHALYRPLLGSKQLLRFIDVRDDDN